MSHRLAAARRAGHGRFDHEWSLPPEAVAAELMAWCRDTISGCRRPWGIGHFDLSIALANAPGAQRTLRMRHVQPAELWPGDGLQDRFASLWDVSTDGHGPIHVVASLFSWGEATHAAAS